MSDKRFPTPEEVQKEFEDFVKNRFGGQVQILTNRMESPTRISVDQEKRNDQPFPDDESHFDLNFDLKPKQVKDYLDQYVIKQDEAKRALAIAICDHYNHVRDSLKNPDATWDYSKQNVLILGPTGVGKTYMIRKIADLIGVPFVKADATRFSETGYVGANVDDLVRDLVTQADGNIEKAQYGIVYLDEADKLASPANSMGRDVNGRGVQFGLLRLMEEAEVDLKSGNDIQSQMQAFMEMQKGGKSSKSLVNTSNILFIVSGAFTGLKDIIKKRVKTGAIGFGTVSRSSEDDENLLSHATTDDFIKFGFEPEFIGRLPVRVSCLHLDKEDLFKILKNSKGSIIYQYEQAFKAYGIEASFTDEAMMEISRKAELEKTGARALMTICEETLRNHKFELPSSSIKKFVIDRETTLNPAEALRNLLATSSHVELEKLIEQVRLYEADFEQKYGMVISFDADATELIAVRAYELKRPVESICSELMHSYEYGLKLVQQSTGETHFVLGKEVVNAPQKELEKLIRDSFSKKDRMDSIEADA